MLALFNVEAWLESGGLLILAAIVFAESGLLIGFFLPGDALLFIAGFLTSAAGPIALNVKPDSLPSLPIVAIVVTIAAIVGDQVGFLFGRKVGPSLFQREQSRFFKPAHVHKAHVFLETHGPKTIVMARFVPIVRTFAPIVAGIAKMDYRTFVTYNIAGGVLWGAGLTTLGHYLGGVSWIKNNIEIASLAIVFFSLLPMILEILKHRRSSRS
ncbi:MAG: DedA family protein [Ilumatobacteraceae bacterium]|nr:DedA family protein [Ilumatobacteraceae bacterium]